MSDTIAPFDFDGTITRHDTLPAFARHAAGASRFVRSVLCSLPAIAAWKLGLRSNGYAKERLFCALYAGMEAVRFNELCNTFADKIDADLNADTMALIERRRADGYEICIVSASPAARIRPWAARHGIDAAHVIATEVEVGADGRLTGRFATPNCYGAEKVRRLHAAFPGCKIAPIYDLSMH